MNNIIKEVERLAIEKRGGWLYYNRQNYSKAIELIDGQGMKFFKMYDIYSDNVNAAMQIIKIKEC